MPKAKQATRKKTSTNNQATLPKLSYQKCLWIILIVAVVGMLYWGWNILQNPNTLPIKSVTVNATYQHVSRQQIKAIMAQYADEGFFSIDVGDVRKQITQLPWVKTVAVRRVWPDRIVVTITEQQAVAVWNNNELMNSQGQVFKAKPSLLPTGLPLLAGPASQATQVWQNYHQMSQLLVPLKLSISELTLNQRGAWRAQLNDGVLLILGRHQVLARVKRFIAVYNKVFANQATLVKSVDLRYPNGFAVDWR